MNIERKRTRDTGRIDITIMREESEALWNSIMEQELPEVGTELPEP